MDPLTAVAIGSTVVGGIKSLFGEDDPYKKQRAQLRKLMAEIRSEFPQIFEGLKIQEAVQRGGMVRGIEDRGAAGGLPRNVIEQNVHRAEIGSGRNLLQALNEAKMNKIRTLENFANMITGVPPKQNTAGPQLLGGGLQMLLSGSGSGYEGDSELQQILKGLFPN